MTHEDRRKELGKMLMDIERRQIIMAAFYIILAGVLLVALFALIVSYREDHPKKSS